MTITAYRGEILSVPVDPIDAGEEAVHYHADGLLIVEDGIIVDRGSYADLADRYAAIPAERLSGLIVPGFVDAHVHYPQLDAIASHGTQLLDWLERYIFPVEAAFSERAHAKAVASVFLDELLRHGTTTALVFATVHEHSVDALFDAALERQMRIVSGKVLMDMGPDNLSDSAESGRAQTEKLIARWRGKGRLGYAVTPRFVLTSSDRQLAETGAVLDAHSDVLLHTHLAENRDECSAAASRFPDAKDYLDIYDRFGLVGDRSVFAHGIHLDDRSWNRLHQSGAGIAFCPTSNLFLGSGLFSLRAADAHRVKLGLGSDIGAGTSLSMLHNAGMAFQVGQMDNYVLDPLRALYLATAGGAKLMRLEDRIGGLMPGQEADFIVLDMNATPLLARRTSGATLHDRLFACQILGDDRVILQSFVNGRCVHHRDHGS